MSIINELQWRGLIHQCTDLETVTKELNQPTILYAGFDPTADSLHVGSLLPLMMLRRFQLAGHRPIALVGGATGMIGDPSGKSAERSLLSKDILERNVEGIKAQMARFLDFAPGSGAILVNNFDWMQSFSFLDFLRDVGKNFPVNVMLAKDSVRNRLENSDSGLSYTEFSYMLLQAFDFVHLAKNYGCKLQIGGSDQWGNITAGIDLGRRMLGLPLLGLTNPLLTTSDGRKMGKTESGTVWLDSNRTSPYQLYQYFINVADADVLLALRFLSDVDEAEYRSLEAGMTTHPGAAQRRLAQSVTKLVHGEAGLASAVRASEYLFGGEIDRLSDHELLSIFADVPSQTVSRDLLSQGLNIVDALVLASLSKSKGEARRLAESGGVYINNRRCEAVDRVLGADDLASESVIVLRTGKKKYSLLRFE
ncbi:MAG: tyrosine--tRNA ligase [Pirellula sp.]|nr:tyrosine--tRNA ligase [Pirellula sp.]